jgi:hypothetical protein
MFRKAKHGEGSPPLGASGYARLKQNYGNDNSKIPVGAHPTAPFYKRGMASHEIAGQARNDEEATTKWKTAF